MDIKDFYEKSAEQYNPEKVAMPMGRRYFITHDDRIEVVVNWLNKELGDKKGLKILDVGCGDGVYEKNIKSEICSNNDFFGLDISSLQLDRSRGSFKQVDMMDFEKQSIPHPNSTFDYVMCSEVLEHLFNPEHILTEIYRVLKPGGLFIITVPNLSCLQNRLAFFIFGDSPNFNYLQNKEHIRFYNKKTIQFLLADKYEFVKQIGINSMLFEKYLFPVRLIGFYFIQKIFNMVLPNLGGGLFLIFRKK